MSNSAHHVILVVEDDLLIRMDSADTLASAGFEVMEAGSADEAIALLEQAQRIELLFSDIDMPGSMDGLALAEMVHKRWPNVRLLLTSGHHGLTDDDVPDDGSFLPKPYSPDAVIETVRALLTEG